MLTLDRVGHTAITWPFTADGAIAAIGELAEAGYKGVEVFGFAIDDVPGGVPHLRQLLNEAPIRLVATYCFADLVNATTALTDVAALRHWATVTAAAGGEIMVVGCADRSKAQYDPDDYAVLIENLNTIGRYSAEHGVTTAFHPHTGTPVERREEIDRVLNGIDPRYVAFAPDLGQIQKGGSDPVDVVRTYRDLVKHVHLKDYVGGSVQHDASGVEIDTTGYLNYVPLGKGVVDIPGIVAALDGFDGWWMVELDGTPAAPRPPADAAAISMRYLESLVVSEGAQSR